VAAFLQVASWADEALPLTVPLMNTRTTAEMASTADIRIRYSNAPCAFMTIKKEFGYKKIAMYNNNAAMMSTRLMIHDLDFEC